MSYYTSDIETNEIQAHTNSSNFRTEFRLPSNKLYMSNMRLMNVGWQQNTAVTPAINRLVGCYGCIKNLSLYDDNELLDGLDNFNLWAAFTCYNKANDANYSTNNFLKKNNTGLTTISSTTNTGASDGINVTVQPLYADFQNSDNSTVPAQSAWLDISAYLDFLKQSRYVPSHYFKRLRIVIEWETDVTNLTPASTATAVSTLEPFLVVDEMVNDQMISEVLKNYGGINYQPIETSRTVLPVFPTLPTSNTDDNVLQEVTFTIQGFNNKSINRLVCMPVGQSNNSNLYGNLNASAMKLDSYQVRTAQGNVLQGQGLTTDNQRRAMMTDLYGDCTDSVGAVWVSAASSAIGTGTEATNSVGWMTPLCVKLEEDMVQNFQVTVGRRSVYGNGIGNQADARYNQQMNLHFFAEVQKQIAVNPKDMSYTIRYL